VCTLQEAIFAEIGGSVARLIEMEEEREKEKSERAVLEEDSGDEEGMNSEDKAKMDEMLKSLNERLDAGGNTSATTPKKAKKKANKRKKSPRGRKEPVNGKDAPATQNEEEKHLAEKLRQKIADSLGQVHMRSTCALTRARAWLTSTSARL
jgi:hypothetical protein